MLTATGSGVTTPVLLCDYLLDTKPLEPGLGKTEARTSSWVSHMGGRSHLLLPSTCTSGQLDRKQSSLDLNLTGF